MTVHPRVGGERLFAGKHAALAGGSSPRGRGTRIYRHFAKVEQRFIPAWAGNVPAAVAPATTSPVHPRVGGERYVIARLVRGAGGSSPRGRGTRNCLTRQPQ